MTVFELIQQLVDSDTNAVIKFRVKGASSKDDAAFNSYADIESNSTRAIIGLDLGIVESDEAKLCATCCHRCRGAFTGEWICDCNESELFCSQTADNDSCEKWEAKNEPIF